jgi:hypothetical protein
VSTIVGTEESIDGKFPSSLPLTKWTEERRRETKALKGTVEGGMDASTEVVNNDTVTKSKCQMDVDFTSRLGVGIQ